ncbi:signal peptidase II [Candidatus Woesearchaeota archaeon]|nr:signal peptidase II [Candidatus Woesearchaeota archaeon]
MVNRHGLFWLIAVGVVLLDQLTKYLAAVTDSALDLTLLQIHLVKNTGAGFGILQNYTGVLTIISLLVAIIVIYHHTKLAADKKILFVLWGIFLGGVIGNLIDRLFLGYVIDFIDFGFWPAFNVADTAITLSVIGIILISWKK